MAVSGLAPDAEVVVTDSLEWTAPAGAPRGAVIVLPGRGDDPSFYRRLSARLASDGFATAVATVPIVSTADVTQVARTSTDGILAIIGVDTSAGLLAAALVEHGLERAPDGVIFAGTATGDSAPPVAEEELAARSACPVHRRVVEEAGASPLAASTVAPSWPEGHARVPVLALHGAADTISPIRDVIPLLASWDAELVTVSGGLHDVLNDVHHRSIAAEIVQFLERLRVGGSTPVLRRERVR